MRIFDFLNSNISNLSESSFSGGNNSGANNLNELTDIFVQLGYYSIVVFGGLLFMLFVFYPLFMKLFGVKIVYKAFIKATALNHEVWDNSMKKGISVITTLSILDEILDGFGCSFCIKL